MDAASQSKDIELLGRLKSTFSQNAAASSIFDTFRDQSRPSWSLEDQDPIWNLG